MRLLNLNWLPNLRAAVPDSASLAEWIETASGPWDDRARSVLDDARTKTADAFRDWKDERVTGECRGMRDRDEDNGLGAGPNGQSDETGTRGGLGEGKRPDDKGRPSETGSSQSGAAADAPPATTPDQENVEPILFVGSGSAEMIEGDLGNDELYGGPGDDAIEGRGGDDYLSGNQGNDILIGGRGADTFSFDGDFDREVVTDFDPEDGDRLEFLLYEPDRVEWKPETMIDFFVQDGRDALLALPGSDERVVLRDFDIADLAPDLVTVTPISDATDLIA